MDYGKLFDLTKEPKELLHDVLLARGFLVEFDIKGNLRLSDNAMLKLGRVQDMWENDLSDPLYLVELLQRSALGKHGDYRRIKTAKNRFTMRSLERLFNHKAIRGEAGYEASMGRPNRFFNSNSRKLKGFKIPVSVLEPYIALLVKAYSAIGVCTCSSCDGHGSGDANISFLSYPYSRWAERVTQIAIDRVKPNSKWDFTDYHLTIKKPKDTENELYYRGILDVARFIYANRMQFCDLRREVIEKVNLRDYGNKEIPREFVTELFEEGLSKFSPS